MQNLSILIIFCVVYMLSRIIVQQVYYKQMLAVNQGLKFQEFLGVCILSETQEDNEGNYVKYLIVQYIKDQYTEDLIGKIQSGFEEFLWGNQTTALSQYVLELYEYRMKQSKIRISHEPFLGVLSAYQPSLTYPQKMMVLNCVSQALLALSVKKICHNWVNPESIVVCRYSSIIIQVKLNNFYYSKKIQNSGAIERDLRHQSAYGITQYSSPQSRSNRKIGLKSDIWSLGALYYSLLFGDDRQINVVDKQVEFEVYDKTPEWMITALKCLLAYDPQKRYDIKRACYFFRSALTCADAGNICFKQVMNNKLIKITV